MNNHHNSIIKVLVMSIGLNMTELINQSTIYTYYLQRRLKEEYAAALRKWWPGSLFDNSYVVFVVVDDKHFSLGIISIPSKEVKFGTMNSWAIEFVDSGATHFTDVSARFTANTTEKDVLGEGSYRWSPYGFVVNE